MSLYTYRAQVSRVVDGDTVDLAWWDLGAGAFLHPTPVQPLRMRLAYTDAYEVTLRGGTTPEQKALGLEAAAWLREQIEGRTVRLRTVKGAERGSFGRWLVWLWPDGDDGDNLREVDSLNLEIIRRGWGVPFDG